MKKDEKASPYQLRKADYLAFAAVILAAALVFAAFLPRHKTGNAYAQVRLEGKVIARLPLDKPGELKVEGRYENTVTVDAGKVAVTASNCPGQDCIHCGWAESPGKTIVCLPNALEIRIVGMDSDVDFVVG